MDLDGDGILSRSELMHLCDTMDAWSNGLTPELFEQVVGQLTDTTGTYHCLPDLKLFECMTM